MTRIKNSIQEKNLKKIENFKIKNFEKGAIIIKEGEISDDIYIIKEGSVEIIKKDQKGQKLVDVFHEGDIFGELGIIFGKKRTATVKAKTDVKVEIINPRSFGDLLETEFGKDIMPIIQGYAKRIREFGMRLSLVDYDSNEDINLMPSKNPEDFESKGFKVHIKGGSHRGLIAMHGTDNIPITTLPFRVGRYSRRRSDWFFHKNELYLHDKYPFNVGRTHFAIIKENNIFYYLDYGSWHGSRVNNVRIDSPNKKQKVALHVGENSVTLGEDASDIKLIIEIKK